MIERITFKTLSLIQIKSNKTILTKLIIGTIHMMEILHRKMKHCERKFILRDTLYSKI